MGGQCCPDKPKKGVGWCSYFGFIVWLNYLVSLIELTGRDLNFKSFSHLFTFLPKHPSKRLLEHNLIPVADEPGLNLTWFVTLAN